MNLDGFRTLVLTEERQYIQENETYWSEVQGDQPTFIGRVSTLPNGQPLLLRVVIPELYPWEKPDVFVNIPIEDPNVSSDRRVNLRILQDWDGGRHRLKDIIFEARRYFNSPERKQRSPSVQAQPVSRTSPLQQEVERLQQQLADLNRTIQVEKETQMQRSGLSYASLTISPQQELRSKLESVDDLLEVLESYFENMEGIGPNDYLNQKVKYSKLKFRIELAIAGKIPVDQIEVSRSSMIVRNRSKTTWDIQTDLYGHIVRVEVLARLMNMGFIQEDLYDRQVSTAVRKILELASNLEQINGFNIEDFYKQYNIPQKFPEATKRLNFIEGGKQPAVKLGSISKDLLSHVNEFASTRITLSDLLLLENYATYSAVNLKLNTLQKAIAQFPESDGLATAIKGWYDKLDRLMREQGAETRLEKQDLDQLLHDVEVWGQEFDELIRRL